MKAISEVAGRDANIAPAKLLRFAISDINVMSIAEIRILSKYCMLNGFVILVIKIFQNKAGQCIECHFRKWGLDNS